MIDNFTRRYLMDMGRQIEKDNKTSDNKAYYIKSEKAQIINGMIEGEKILESDRKQALKYINNK